MKNKILCLGNEFILEDSLAKKIGEELKKQGLDIININDSFQLLNHIGESGLVIIDVVKDLDNCRIIDINDLSKNNILTAHDLDAGFFLKLFGENKDIKIIGIPMKGEVENILDKVGSLLDE